MSYDEVTAEISKLRARLSQKKTEFIVAKENVEELKSLFLNFENNDLAYDNEKYQEALSAFDSGDYLAAQNLSNEALDTGKSIFSEMEEAKMSLEHFENIINHLKSKKLKHDQESYNSAKSEFTSGNYSESKGI